MKISEKNIGEWYRAGEVEYLSLGIFVGSKERTRMKMEIGRRPCVASERANA